MSLILLDLHSLLFSYPSIELGGVAEIHAKCLSYFILLNCLSIILLLFSPFSSLNKNRPLFYLFDEMKFLDYCCSRPRSHHRPPSRHDQPSSLGRPSPSLTNEPVIIITDPFQTEALHAEKPAMAEAPAEEEEDISTVVITADDHFRPMLRRGRPYSAEAFRKNGAVRMKSGREPPTSARDICWIENNNEKEEINENQDKQQTRITYTPAIPPPSWSRFPSHSRAERSCSSAGIEDQVYARDFAFEARLGSLSGGDKAEEGGQGSTRRYRRHTFEKSMARKLHRYHSARLRPTRSGFRSSISMGGVLEYPELAILPSLEAIPLVSRADVSPQLVVIYDDDDENPTSKNVGILNNHGSSLGNNPRDAGTDVGPDSDRAAVDGGARAWSQIYEGCLLPRPTTSDETTTVKDGAKNAFLRPEDGSRHSRQSSHQSSHQSSRQMSRQSSRQSSRQLSEHRRCSPRSSTEMRSSTVNFQKSLEEYEIRAKERALQAASDASLRRPKEGSWS